MKGQASIEYMLVFMASLAAVSLLCIPMLSARERISERSEELEAVYSAESAARAVEAMHSCGMDMRFDFEKEGVRHSVEGGRFHSRHEGRLIEIEGVFHYDPAEPV